MARHKIIRTNGQRIAWKNTSKIADAEVAAAIRYVAKEVDLDRTIVHFKKLGERRRTWGRAYAYVPSVANLDGLRRHEWLFLITVTDHGVDRMIYDVLSTLAHEAKHVEQYRERTSRSEVRCRAFEKWVADRWLAEAVAELTPA